MKKLPFEVVEIDLDLDPIATWGQFATYAEALEVFNALVDEKTDEGKGFALRHHNKNTVINPPAR